MKKGYDFSKEKRGPVLPTKGKTRIAIYLDTDVLEAFRERADRAGHGYQTMINEVLRKHIADEEPPISESILRQVVREELERAGSP
ncbi:MAG: BrnA antitoxin family protein [Desulfococcaceae bacterium]